LDQEIKAYEQLKDYAFYLLSFRMRTQFEMKEKLSSKQENETIVNKVMVFLINEHYLDDLLFAENFVNDYKKKFGAYQLKQKLRQKRISNEIIESVLSDESILDESQSMETAKKLAEKKLNSTPVNSEKYQSDYNYRAKVYQKIYAYLAYRGFSSSIIKEVLRGLLNEEFFDEE